MYRKILLTSVQILSNQKTEIELDIEGKAASEKERERVRSVEFNPTITCTAPV